MGSACTSLANKQGLDVQMNKWPNLHALVQLHPDNTPDIKLVAAAALSASAPSLA